MAKYDAQAALALRLVTSKGARTTFTRDGAIIDPVTQVSVGSPTEYTAPTLAIAMSPREARRQFGEAINISIARLSVTIAMSGVTETPRGGDKFSWGGKAYALMMDPELLDPAGDGPIIATGYAEAA